MTVRVGWIFSLIRSGSSAAAYAAAAPWNHPVADEVFGPWDRTGPPYNYPPAQLELAAAFHGSACRLTDDVIELARQLFRQLGERTGCVVCKCPHLLFTPDEFARAFPDHRAVYLIRNPLHRLNSHYARRQWLATLGPDFDLGTYREFARRWRAAPGRLVYDTLRRDPDAFFAALYQAWNWPAGAREIRAAADYARRHYHSSSRLRERRNPRRPVAEARFRLPRDAVTTYLNDPEIVELMRELGWSVHDADYLAPRAALH